MDAGTGEEPVRVVGTMVLPSIGQFLSDRTGLGVGAFVLAPERQVRENVTFTGVHLADDIDPARFLRDIRGQLASWDGSGSPPFTYAAPVRPAEIVNAGAMRAAPAILAGVLALALLTALMLSIGSTVNGRRRDYAVYRAIGFRRGQVGRSVRWQALATMAAGLVVGIPIGIVVGRYLWERFAEQLGIASTVDVSAWLLVVIAFGALDGGVAAATIPARRVSRRSPVEALSGQ